MAGATMTTADAALKEFYLPGAREQLNNDIPLLANLEKNTEDIEGRRAVLSLHVSRNSGVGARGENVTSPTAGAQGYAEERVPLKKNVARIQLSVELIRNMKSDRGAFVRATASEMKGAVRDLKREVSRQCWLNGDGKIATCGTTTASATVQLAAATSAVQMRFFAVGDKVDIGTVAAPTTIVAAAVISAVDATNKTITIDSAVTTSASHFVFRAGNNTANATYEVTGLQKIVAASGTLHNVDPSTYDVWKSTVSSNSGTNRSISEELIGASLHAVDIASGQSPNMGVGSDGVFRAFGSVLKSQKRFPNEQSLKGGYKALECAAGGTSLPITWDRDAPANQLFLLNTEHLSEFVNGDWDWMDEDGAVLSRVSGVTAYEATLFKLHEIATDERNSHGLIKDITEAAAA